MRKGIAFLDEPVSRKLLLEHCRKAGISISTIEQLVQEEVSVVGLERRDGLFQRMHEIIRESVGLSDDENLPEAESWKSPLKSPNYAINMLHIDRRLD